MEAFDVSAVTIAAVRKTFVEQGLEVALHRKKLDREYEHVLDGEGEKPISSLWLAVNHRMAESIGFYFSCKIVS
jgi:hypothetical protein